MANEITASVNVTVVNGSFRQAFQPATKQITQSAIGGHITVWNVGTSEEDLSTGDVSTLGVIGLLNTDTTNYVQMGKKVAGVMEASMRLKPGEPNFIRSEPGITWRAKADTAACKVLVWIMES